MEISEIRQQLSQVDQIINRATQALQNDKAASRELKECVQQLGAQSKQAQQALKRAEDGAVLVQCIEDLERISDRALQACEHANNLGAQAKTAVHQAYEQLSELNEQLH
jgi:phage shock protein A